MRFRLLASVLACIALAACTSSTAPKPDRIATLLSRDDRRIDVRVEIAADRASREKGLMGRTSLADGDGMLFVFEGEQPLGFWMKNTLIPLDIIYFDGRGEFVSSATMAPCQADPCATYPSAAPASFALEVPSGWLARNGVGEGWSLHLPE